MIAAFVYVAHHLAELRRAGIKPQINPVIDFVEAVKKGMSAGTGANVQPDLPEGIDRLNAAHRRGAS